MTPAPSRSRSFAVSTVLLLFTALVSLLHGRLTGEDLASSYVGCRLLAAGQGSHLYSHSTRIFSNIHDPVWDAIGRLTHFSPVELLHPYVQTPLWAYSLQPLCLGMDFPAFRQLFVVLTTVSMAAVLWLIARFWAPRLFAPLPMALVCALLYISEPFRYALYLVQTHVLYILLSLGALLLAERKRPLAAGLALALAAAVKITPGFLLLYWLFTRRYRAAVSFVVASCILLGLTVATTGLPLFRAYLHELSETSNVLLVAFNVQSLAAWVTGPHFGRWELLDWKIHKLPFAIKAASLLLALSSAALGGWLDRLPDRTAAPQPELPQPEPPPPYGAAFALLGATMFTPIAWDHYYLLMVLPLALLFSQRTLSPRLTWGLLATMVLLNLYPVRFGIEHGWLGRFVLVRTQWYGGLLALATMALLHRRSRLAVLPAAATSHVADSNLAPI